jgi:hypothetical protein
MGSIQHNKRKGIEKFLILCSIFVAYTLYLSMKYDFVTGGLSALLTWSFFVLCTPIADAGFLIDFPLRLLFNIRMVLSELFVWGIAIGTNFIALNWYPNAYDTTGLTRIFHTILTTPNPYWIIIFLSAIGTFLSLFFGDALFDIFRKKEGLLMGLKEHLYQIILMVVIFGLTLIIYYHLLHNMNISLGGSL